MLSPGITFLRIPNPNIKWESTAQTNIGLDMGILMDRLMATVDLFFKKTEDVLREVTAAAPEPTQTQWLNVPGLQIINNGLEPGVDGIIIDHTDLTWEAGFNISFIKNDVKNLPVTIILTGNHQ